MFESFRELWLYRPMLRNLVRREIRGRYKGSVLGFLWNFLLPLVQILVYVLVFGAIFRQNIEDYYIYMAVGMVAWIMFSDSIGSGAGSVVDNSSLVTKIHFPRAVIPVAVVLSKFVNFLISLAIVYAVIIVSGHGVNPWALAELPVAVVLLTLFSAGLALALSAVNVYVRDTMYLVNVATMLWIWLTPVMYVRDYIGSGLLNAIIDYNPMTYFIQTFQDAMYWGTVTEPAVLLLCAAMALISFFGGWAAFQRLSGDFAEVLRRTGGTRSRSGTSARRSAST